MPDEKAVPSFLSMIREQTMLEGETLSDFSAQYKKLTDDDKKTLSEWATAQGIVHEYPKVLAR